jgi:diguanylate cyclase (GGDEF)-like protein
VPVEFLVAVLGLSVVANAALLFWLARADHITIHWPLGGGDPGKSEWPDLTARDAAGTRRRSIFVAGQSEPLTAPRPGIPISTGTPGTSPLPPDLAELLSRPAPLGPAVESHGQTAGNPGGNGSRGSVPQGTLVRVHTGPGMALPPGVSLDALTGLENQQSWNRIIEVENARLLRYRRPSTVIVAELDGLRRLAERMGEDPVARLLPVVADAFRAEARSSDWVARIGYGRFAAFLAETDEIAAINYVERIRQICEPWLQSAAVPLRLAIGWSSPSAASDLEFAIKRAEERMHADRRLPAKLPAPRFMGPRMVAIAGGDPSLEEAEPTVVSPAEPGSAGNEAAGERQ